MSQGHIPAGSCSPGLRSPRQLSDPRGQAWLLASPSCHRGQRAGTCHSPCTPHQPRAPPSPRNVRLALQGGHMPGTRGHAQAVTGPAGHRLSPRPPAPGDEVGQPVMALPLPRPPGNLPPGGVQGARQAAQGQGPRPARVPRPLPHSHRTREEAGASEQGAGGRAACCPRGRQSLRDKGPAPRQAPLERTFVTTRTSRRAWCDPLRLSTALPKRRRTQRTCRERLPRWPRAARCPAGPGPPTAPRSDSGAGDALAEALRRPRSSGPLPQRPPRASVREKPEPSERARPPTWDTGPHADISCCSSSTSPLAPGPTAAPVVTVTAAARKPPGLSLPRPRAEDRRVPGASPRHCVSARDRILPVHPRRPPGNLGPEGDRQGHRAGGEAPSPPRTRAPSRLAVRPEPRGCCGHSTALEPA